MSEQQPPGQPQGTPPAPPQHPGQGQYPGQQYPGQQPGQQYPSQGQQYPVQGQQYPVQHSTPHMQGAPQYAPGAPAPGYPSAPTASAGALGRVAFIVALVSLGIGLLVALSFPFLIRAVDYSSSLYGAVSAVGNGLVLLIAIAALILGIVAVRRPGQQVLAGIAIGIAASEILGILVSWLSNLALTLTYG